MDYRRKFVLRLMAGGIPESELKFTGGIFNFMQYYSSAPTEENFDFEDFKGCGGRPGKIIVYGTGNDNNPIDFKLAWENKSQERVIIENPEEPFKTVQWFGASDKDPFEKESWYEKQEDQARKDLINGTVEVIMSGYSHLHKCKGFINESLCSGCDRQSNKSVNPLVGELGEFEGTKYCNYFSNVDNGKNE